MREIKFRGKDECNDEWVFGVPVQDSDIKNRWYLIYGYSDGADRIIVHPETIGQYTGLKDKNGKEIYEGDYVETGNGRVFEIRIGEYKYHNETTAYGFYMHSKYGDIPLNNNIEIVGNIFENEEYKNI